jgi:hypothetical protein
MSRDRTHRLRRRDFHVKHSARRCPFCGQPATHVVKWPWGEVEGYDGAVVDVRRYYDRACAARVLTHQRSIGSRARSYRYRRVA